LQEEGRLKNKNQCREFIQRSGDRHLIAQQKIGGFLNVLRHSSEMRLMVNQ
jgi:hypothetical protein